MHLTRNREAAEELYQECWVRVLMKLDMLRSAENAMPWLTKICVNLYRDGLRKEKLRRFFPLGEEDKHTEEDHTGKIELKEAVERLPDKLRLAFILTYVEGYSEKETASILGISCGGVKSRLSRARQFLREVLEDR